MREDGEMPPAREVALPTGAGIVQLDQLSSGALRELVLQALGELAVQESRSLLEVVDELQAEVQMFTESINNGAGAN